MIWSTYLLERPHRGINRSTHIVGEFANDSAIERLVGTAGSPLSQLPR
jgi:hypothetical protein